VQPKFSCRAGEAIRKLRRQSCRIRRGRALAALLAHVLVAKYTDALPLYHWDRTQRDNTRIQSGRQSSRPHALISAMMAKSVDLG
jgi:transposase